jgi:hypothetical protein
MHAHSQRLENWLGRDHVEQVSHAMKDFYYPIALHGVPGNVIAMPGGDFTGHVDAGQFGSKMDRAEDILRRQARQLQAFVARGWRLAGSPRYGQLNAGFTSLSDLVAEATSGKYRQYHFNKVGVTGVLGATNTLWHVGAHPAAGAAGSAAPGGRQPTDATTGAHLIDNVSADTRHIVAAYATATVAGQNLLLYDRIFDVAKTMSSTSAESVTGVPLRYQSSTTTAADYAGGSFCFVECTGALSATAHNWTVCQYRDQDGNDAQSFPSMAGNSSNISGRLDHPVNQWFMPLATGDIGVMDLAQMQCSASVTGTITFVVGHPLAWVPCPIANLVTQYDFVRTAFNLVRIFDDAALAWLEVNKPATTATTYNMGITAVHG